MRFLKSIKLSGLLSFPPDSPTIELTPLNVLIGPNGSGKSNLIEAIELLHATPTAFASAIRDGGGVQEWMWKGRKKEPQPSNEMAAILSTSQRRVTNSFRNQEGIVGPASIEAIVQGSGSIRDLLYSLTFAPAGQRTEVVDELLEEAEKRDQNEEDVYFFYRFQDGHPVLNVRNADGGLSRRSLRREDIVPDESVLSQRKGSDVYPEITWLGQQFARIQTFREWSFGRFFPLRQPQPADLQTDVLLPDARNLGLLLNRLEHTDASADFNRLLSRFLPRYERFSTLVQGGTVQFYLHESGLRAPVPAMRLSDGTMRFMAILALLLSPEPPPLLCLEEPELGLHPDAVGLLSDLLVDASTRMQLIVTTHSDGLISGLTENASSVLVCEHRGGTRLERIDPHTLTHWLERYRLGEVWRIGELGGNL